MAKHPLFMIGAPPMRRLAPAGHGALIQHAATRAALADAVGGSR